MRTDEVTDQLQASLYGFIFSPGLSLHHPSSFPVPVPFPFPPSRQSESLGESALCLTITSSIYSPQFSPRQSRLSLH